MTRNEMAEIIADWFLEQECIYAGWDEAEFRADIEGVFDFRKLADNILSLLDLTEEKKIMAVSSD